MAKILDPDLLVRATSASTLGVDGNIFIDTVYRFLFLAPYLDLTSEDGVTVQALYSYLKEEWKTDSDLIKFPFPMVAITPEQFEFVDSWQPANMDTVYLFRDGGFAVKDATGASSSEFPCMITLGSLGETDQVYYQQTPDGLAKDINLPGSVNQCVKVYGITQSTGIAFEPDEEARVTSSIPYLIGSTYDLSTSYHLIITVDAEGPIEVDIQGSTPAATTAAEVVAAINAEFTGTPAAVIDDGTYEYIQITGTATTNGNYVTVIDGTTTTGVMSMFSAMGSVMMDEAGDHINSTGGQITTFHPGEVITVTGSVSNDGNYTISSIRSDYTRMTTISTDDALVTEAAGANIQVLADARSYFKIFTREYQKSYAQAELNDIGISTVTYQAYRFPLANATDLKITHDDTAVSTTLPYTDMDITYLDGVGFTAWADSVVYPANSVVSDGGRWYITPTGGTSSGTGTGDDVGVTDWESFSGERDIGGTYYAFNIVIDADASGDGSFPTAEEIYEFVQYSLRQDSDIDAGAGIVTGKTADLLLSFVGDTLVTESGVYVDDFSETDINRIEFYDYAGVKQVYPFVAAGTINFNDNLVADSGAVYTMFFTNDNAGADAGADFGTSAAIIVNDNDSSPISGDVNGSTTQFTYDYDGNIQRGAGSAATDVPVTLVAIGLDKAQYVKTTGTIGRSNSNTFSLVASLERNYSNPA